MIYLELWVAWALFGFVHSLTAAGWVKKRSARWLGLYYRLAYNALALLTFLPVLFLHHRAPAAYLWSTTPLTRGFGFLLILSGLAIGVVALRTYNLREFVGWPVSQTSLAPGSLQQDGLLAYVRHPLYTGTLLGILGLLLATPTTSNLIFLLAATGYIRIGIYFEEQKLVRTFGDAYVRYRQQTPMLIPRLGSQR